MSDSRKVWINGELMPWEQATVPLLSHGFSRGSAIFEVFGVHPGPDGPMAFRMDEHLKRLASSARLLGMRLDRSTEEIGRAVTEVVQANGLGRGLVKILAYYGDEAVISLLLDSALDLAIFAIQETEELGLDRATPITACFSKWQKIPPEAVPPSAKACANYLSGMLARKDAAERGYDVGLLLDTDGFVAEGSIESVFMVKDGVLKTPPLGRILSSITRKSLLQAAPALGIETSEAPIRPQDLLSADEVFTCHTGIKVLPVRRLEDRVFEPAPGPVTTKLSRLMADICTFKDDRFKDWFQPLGRYRD